MKYEPSTVLKNQNHFAHSATKRVCWLQHMQRRYGQDGVWLLPCGERRGNRSLLHLQAIPFLLPAHLHNNSFSLPWQARSSFMDGGLRAFPPCPCFCCCCCYFLKNCSIKEIYEWLSPQLTSHLFKVYIRGEPSGRCMNGTLPVALLQPTAFHTSLCANV